MPKKKTGQRKKKEKQKILQKAIQRGRNPDDVILNPVNIEMICDSCQRRQRSRFFCYFCQATQKLVSCAECSRIKCLAGGGDCAVKHPGRNVTGAAFVGAICDFCECGICHSIKCLRSHACSCIFRRGEDSIQCAECSRGPWDCGGRFFRCATCSVWLCEDDHFEHQASCQILESETYKCQSCNRLGVLSCLKCKVCYCAEHARGHTFDAQKLKKGKAIPCKKCGYELQETKDLSISVRRHEYGRQRAANDSDDNSCSYNRAFASGMDYENPSDEWYHASSDESDYEDDSNDDSDDDGSEKE